MRYARYYVLPTSAFPALLLFSRGAYGWGLRTGSQRLVLWPLRGCPRLSALLLASTGIVTSPSALHVVSWTVIGLIWFRGIYY